MCDDLVAGLPGINPGADAQHDAGGVGSDHVVGQIMTPTHVVGAAQSLEEAEGRHRLEDRCPHGVVVDGTRHDGDERLAGTRFGQGYVVDVE